MNSRKRPHLKTGLLVVGGAPFVSGTAGGGALLLIWPLVCIGMMPMMMRGISGVRNGPDQAHDSASGHTHEAGQTHPRR